MSTWGWHCERCQTMQRVGKDRFLKLVNMFELAIDAHRKTSPQCRPPMEALKFIDWKENPNHLLGDTFRQVNGVWKTVNTVAVGQKPPKTPVNIG